MRGGEVDGAAGESEAGDGAGLLDLDVAEAVVGEARVPLLGWAAAQGVAEGDLGAGEGVGAALGYESVGVEELAG